MQYWHSVRSLIVVDRHAPARRIALLTAILLLAAFLRIRNLDANGLWVDEIFTAVLAGPANSPPQVIRNAVTTPLPQPPLWYLTSYVTFLLVGISDFAVRLPAVFVGLLGIAVVYHIGAKAFGESTGVLSALLLTMSPLHLYVSREGRFYGALVFLSLCSIFFLLKALKYNKRRYWVLYTIFSIADIYVHLTGSFLVVSEGVVVLTILFLKWREAEKPPLVAWAKESMLVPYAICAGAIALSYLPMALALIPGLGGERGLGSTEGTDGFAVSLPFVLGMFVSFGPGIKLPGGLYIAASLWGGGALYNRNRRLFILIAIMIFVPIFIIWLARPKHWFAYKYVIHLLPLYLILVATGIRQLASLIKTLLDEASERWRPLAHYSFVVLAILFAGMGALSFNEAYGQRSDHWYNVGVLLNDNVQSNDAVAVLPVNLLTMSAEEVMGYYFQSDPSITTQSVYSVPELVLLSRSHRRVWLVVGPGVNREESNDVLQWIRLQPRVEIVLEGNARIVYFGYGIPKRTLLAEVKDFESDDARLFSSLAVEYRGLGDWESSLDYYRLASEIDPTSGFYHLNQALILERLGSAEQAEQQFLAAQSAQPGVAGFSVVLARFYERNHRTREAILAYQHAMQVWRVRVGTNNEYYVEWKDTVERLEAELVDENE